MIPATSTTSRTSSNDEHVKHQVEVVVQGHPDSIVENKAEESEQHPAPIDNGKEYSGTIYNLNQIFWS